MSKEIHLTRSLLFLPASNQRAVEKALSGDLKADVFILDLEDAVPTKDKEKARQMAIHAVPKFLEKNYKIVVRINQINGPQAEADLSAIIPLSPSAILLPKIEECSSVEGVRAFMGNHPVSLWVMIETALGVLNSASIVAMPGVSALIAGANDLRSDINSKPLPGRHDIHHALQHIILSAKAHNALVFDSVYNDFRDSKGFEQECVEGHAFGFDGKTLIHPNQIGPCNVAFSPSKEDYEKALKLVANYGDFDAGAQSVDGQMVEALHIEKAKALIETYEFLNIAKNS